MALKYSVGEIGRRINDVACEGLVGERTAAETISFLMGCVDQLLAGEFPDPDEFPALLAQGLVAA